MHRRILINTQDVVKIILIQLKTFSRKIIDLRLI